MVLELVKPSFYDEMRIKELGLQVSHTNILRRTENISPSQNMSNSFGSAASESLARRAQATVQDPVFQRMKEQFTSDFDFTMPGASLLHNLISKLKKWIKILEEKTKQLPK